MISFARQDLILRPIEKRLYLFADERSEGENNFAYDRVQIKETAYMSYFINTMYASDVTKTRYGSFWLKRRFISVININRQGRGLELCKIDLSPQ